ncbi:MAG: Lpg1974 family pore-forming outer membrane protein [Parachlamydiales bacterium]
MSIIRRLLLVMCASGAAVAWEASADLLYWFASEEPQTVWATAAGEAGFNQIFFRPTDLSFDWDYGVRLGVGQTCGRWDLRLYWTGYWTKGRDALPDTGAIIFPEFFGGFVNGDQARSGQVRWGLNYGMFDWELGRPFCLCGGLTLRPFLALKGGWINQTIHSSWQNETSGMPPVNFDSTEDLSQDFWGIGPSGGLNSKWALCRYLSLVGDFSAAMLWGNWDFDDLYRNTLGKEIRVTLPHSHLGGSMLRGFVGVRGETFCRCHLAASLGYEMQIWFDQLRIATFQQLRLHGDLTIQGVTFRCQCDF